MYEIIFSETARKQLRKLPKEIQERIVHAVEKIRIQPEKFVAKLVGDSAYKLRVGDYRILMDIQHDDLIILVIKVGHRRNIYD